jgi:predicted ester cyclase
MIRWIMRGTHNGPFMGIPATGKPVTVAGIDVFRIANGQIVELWQHLDHLGMLQQLGVIPTPEQPGS